MNDFISAKERLVNPWRKHALKDFVGMIVIGLTLYLILIQLTN